MWIEWFAAVFSSALALGVAWMTLGPSPVIWRPINDEIATRVRAAVDVTAGEGGSGGGPSR